MSRTPFSRLRHAWLRLAERNVERLEEQGVLKDGKPNPEYANAGMLNLAYVAGLGGLLYIGAGIHLLAMCLLLSLGLGVATGLVWRSGAVPPFFFGRGWRTVRYAEDPALFWLNLSTLVVGFVVLAVVTVWVVADAAAG